ncbi:hypothetical protein ACA910_009678 [Epithemia clementina (nom. ined.)]
MTTPAQSERIAFFLLGAASAAALTFLFQRYHHGADRSSHDYTRGIDHVGAAGITLDQQSRFKSSSSSSTKSKDKDDKATASEIWDSPDLDLRLLQKAEAVVRWRTMGLTVVVERCTNDHNYSAILRTVEALGIQHVAIVDSVTSSNSRRNHQLIVEKDNANTENHDDDDDDGNGKNNNKSKPSKANGDPKFLDSKSKRVQLTPQELEQHHLHRLFAQNATEWLTITEYATTKECVDALQATGHQIWVTDLSQKAVSLMPEALMEYQQQATTTPSLSNNGSTNGGGAGRCWPIPDKLAIVFGTEAVGCSQEMLDLADLRVYLPLRGFADSLNLSVATALVLHHLFLLHPQFVGMSTEEEKLELRRLWFPKLAQQRLLSSREKRERRRLLAEISKCQSLQAKKTGQQEDGSTAGLNKEQEFKLSQLEHYQKQLAALEESARYHPDALSSSAAFQEWIHNPPEPLTDLRRPDSHRISFVGKSTRKNNQDHWIGMAATTHVQSKENATASFFRQFLAAKKPS